MKKNKLVSLILIFVIMLCTLFVTFNKISVMKVKADSGFDSSYDSGSSGSSDWGSDSSSSWSSNDYDSDSSSSGGAPITAIMFFIIFVVVIIIIRRKGVGMAVIALDHTKEKQDEDVKKFIPNFNKQEFLQERYQDYLDIQKAWTDFDYDAIRNKVTDELYNQYSMQLDTLKVKNEKNIMKDFAYNDAMITDVSEENNQITVTLELTTQFIDYIDKAGTPVRGNSISKISMHYEMKFVCNMTSKLDKCPNCGAELTNSASKKCEYCGSIVTGLSDKWVMSKKEAKNQK